MCGIAGLLAPRPDAAPDLAVVKRFAAALRHRGPDGGGFLVEGPMALAHRRLSIIDLSEAGRQPMTSEDGSVAIVVNGEIYNHLELRRELEAKGHRFRSQSDSEVVVHLYEEVGPELPARLEGMFALAVWDARAGRLLLARDRFGEKPLYYTMRRDGLAFASELSALLADPGTAAEIDATALDLYLTLQYVPAPLSIFRDIRKLPAGCLLQSRCDGEPELRRYYELRAPSVPAEMDEDEAAARVRATVEQAVRARLMSDVPLGAFLSGGIDSSIVVACMACASTSRVKTFSVGFTGTESSELPQARLVAERYGTEHHEFVVDPKMVDLLPSIARHHGEPFGDTSVVPTRHLCELTRRHVTVALSGDGGDEAFGGYLRYRWAALTADLRRLPWPLPRLAATLGLCMPGPKLLPVRRIGRRLLDDEASRYLLLVCHFPVEERTSLYGPAMRELLASRAALELFRRRLAASQARDCVTRLCELDAATYLPDDIFTKVDIASMTFGLESRAPFVDHHVMELGASLPDRLKLRGGLGKVILRKAFADLVPAPLLRGGKRGFALPIRQWLSGPLHGFARDLLLSPEARGRGLFRHGAIEELLLRHRRGENHGERIWNLIVLEQWFRTVVDGRAAWQQEIAHAAERAA